MNDHKFLLHVDERPMASVFFVVIPAKAGIQPRSRGGAGYWIPAFEGVAK
jgi:hypothetical protein